MAAKLKKGDKVIVLSGKDKGKQGSITKILNNGRCYVSGVQMVKRHTKPNPNAGIAGGVVEKESTINISNISLFENIFGVLPKSWCRIGQFFPTQKSTYWLPELRTGQHKLFLLDPC